MLLASPTAEHPDAELVGDAIKMAAAVRGRRMVRDGVIFRPIADQPTRQRISRNCGAASGLRCR
jgi:hypothetical protein